MGGLRGELQGMTNQRVVAMIDRDELLGFGGGARTATAKVGKPDLQNAERLLGFETGARAVTAKIGKLEPAPAETKA